MVFELGPCHIMNIPFWRLLFRFAFDTIQGVPTRFVHWIVCGNHVWWACLSTVWSINFWSFRNPRRISILIFLISCPWFILRGDRCRQVLYLIHLSACFREHLSNLVVVDQFWNLDLVLNLMAILLQVIYTLPCGVFNNLNLLLLRWTCLSKQIILDLLLRWILIKILTLHFIL